jgi:hypothetical protein
MQAFYGRMKEKKRRRKGKKKRKIGTEKTTSEYSL